MKYVRLRAHLPAEAVTPVHEALMTSESVTAVHLLSGGVSEADPAYLFYVQGDRAAVEEYLDGGDALTDRQREVLAVARDVGYYDVPRDAGQSDVADALGLAPGTVAEHFRKPRLPWSTRHWSSRSGFTQMTR
jgi:hypothetical protein